ncbi:MAG: CHAD domain-containing protein [Methanoregula sp.]
MTVPRKVTIPHNGLCWYGMQKLPGLLDAFTGEIAGVKEAQDIEYIHRMRVASRRLRAALPLFRTCFPDKQYMKWMQEITRITRALGTARDADVQIAFLVKSLKKIQKGPGLQKKMTPSHQPSLEPAIRFLLLALQKERSLYQKRVLSAILRLEESRVPDEMRSVFTTMGTNIRATRKKPTLYGIPPVAALRIRKRLSTLLSYDPWVLHPEAVAEHHATRIAAKKLRYTMEIYGTLYRNNLKKPLARVKKMQEILGDIHDCDVWIDHITTILLRERTLLRSEKDTGRPDTTTLSSLKVLLRNRDTERKRRYRQFVRYWQTLIRVQLWDELRASMDTGRKSSFRPPESYRDDEAAGAVNVLAGVYPGIRSHSRHVTDLALMLFDSLQPLHSLGVHDRFLLGCAGELHDIGWKYGQPGHNRRGAEMLFTDETLPFDLEERGILAFIVLSHRGKVRPATCPYLDFISPEYRKNVLMLAAILRIADGLDYPHTGSVQEVHCIIAADNVTCTVTGTGDTTVEKARAQGKAELFVEVFNKLLVIR